MENYMMQKIYSTTLVCIILAIFSMDKTASECIRTLRVGDGHEAEHTRLISSSFIGNTYAWFVPSHGRNLLYTKDGGKQWNTVPSEVVNVFGEIWFINELQGWTVGSKGVIWKTSDGGKHWINISELESQNEKGFFAKKIQF